VIETTGAKKSREDLANSAVIVDYGTGSAGYGTYSKRSKKSKEWSKQGLWYTKVTPVLFFKLVCCII
jgi:hypothetical protein